MHKREGFGYFDESYKPSILKSLSCILPIWETKKTLTNKSFVILLYPLAKAKNFCLQSKGQLVLWAFFGNIDDTLTLTLEAKTTCKNNAKTARTQPSFKTNADVTRTKVFNGAQEIVYLFPFDSPVMFPRAVARMNWKASRIFFFSEDALKNQIKLSI